MDGFCECGLIDTLQGDSGWGGHSAGPTLTKPLTHQPSDDEVTVDHLSLIPASGELLHFTRPSGQQLLFFLMLHHSHLAFY